jgi:hypothetical protein
VLPYRTTRGPYMITDTSLIDVTQIVRDIVSHEYIISNTEFKTTVRDMYLLVIVVSATAVTSKLYVEWSLPSQLEKKNKL